MDLGGNALGAGGGGDKRDARVAAADDGRLTHLVTRTALEISTGTSGDASGVLVDKRSQQAGVPTRRLF